MLFLWVFLSFFYTFVNSLLDFPFHTGVSYNEKGELMAGAGTSFYLKAGSFLDEKKPLKYIYTSSIDPLIASDTILLSYYQDKAYLTTATINEKNEVWILPSMNSIENRQIRGLTTLSSSLAIAEIVNGATSTIYYATISIDAAKNVILHSNEAVLGSIGSYLNTLGRFSENQFVTVYYDSWMKKPQLQHITIGTVQGNTITMSEKVLTFGNTSMDGFSYTTYSNPISIMYDGLPAFVLLWFTEPETASTNNESNLCILVGNEKNGSPNKLFEICNNKYRPAYRLDNGVQVADNKFAIAFYDQNNKYGVTIIMVEVTRDNINILSEIVVPGTDKGSFNFGEGYAWAPSPSLTLLDNNRLAVGFHSSTGDGIPSTAVFAISNSDILTLVSPVVPFTMSFIGMSTSVLYESYATTLAVQAFSKGRYFAGFLGPKGSIVQSQATVISSGYPSIGLVSQNTEDASTYIATQGNQTGLKNLIPGYTYYITATGDLRGADPSVSSIGLGGIIIGDNELIVSKDSIIGLALTVDVLLLTPTIKLSQRSNIRHIMM